MIVFYCFGDECAAIAAVGANCGQLERTARQQCGGAGITAVEPVQQAAAAAAVCGCSEQRLKAHCPAASAIRRLNRRRWSWFHGGGGGEGSGVIWELRLLG